MSYRDDHEAAVARVEALDRQLAGAQAEGDELRVRIASLEAIRARSAAFVDLPSTRFLPTSKPWMVLAIGLTFGIVITTIVAIALTARSSTIPIPALSFPTVTPETKVGRLYGSLVMTNTQLGGNWVLDPDACTATTYEGIDAVELVDPRHPDQRLRVVSGARDGDNVAITIDSAERWHPLTAKLCALFDWSLERDGAALAGHVKIGCRLGDASALSGWIDFKNCR